MYPLKFNPIFKSMIWGGDKLRQYKAIDTDQKNIGESWNELLGRETISAYAAAKGSICRRWYPRLHRKTA